MEGHCHCLLSLAGLLDRLTPRERTFITKFYTVVKSPQKQALAPVYIVKSSVTLNKRAIQKLIKMGLNPSNYTQGDFERAPITIKDVDWLCGMWI